MEVETTGHEYSSSRGILRDYVQAFVVGSLTASLDPNKGPARLSRKSGATCALVSSVTSLAIEMNSTCSYLNTATYVL